MARSVEEDQVLLHIGDIRADHNYIGRAEYYPDIDRNILFCPSGAWVLDAYVLRLSHHVVSRQKEPARKYNGDCISLSILIVALVENQLCTCAGKCSDVSGEISASLAHAAIAFKAKQGVGKLAKEYWRKAVMAYKQTGADSMTFGNSNEVFDLLGIYYPSSGVRSHVFFAAASMWVACTKLGTGVCSADDAAMYKAHALELATMKEADGGQKWFWEVPGWDNAWWDGAMLMAQMGVEGPEIFGKPAFKEYLGVFARKWTYGLAPIRYVDVSASIYKTLCSWRFQLGICFTESPYMSPQDGLKL